MIYCRTKLAVIFILTSLLSITIAVESNTDDKIEKIDDLLNTYHRYRLFNGSVLVAKNGEVIYQKGFGLADIKQQLTNTPSTKFCIASLTKAFTALLIMQLVEKERIELNDPISDYLKEYPEPKGDLITIHHCLSHTSGIPDYSTFRGFWSNQTEISYPADTLIKLFSDSTLEFAPGIDFKYSNSGYIILGKIIEQVTGKSYAEVLKEKILDPLNMVNSGYDNTNNQWESFALGYNRTLTEFVPAIYQNMSNLFSAAGMYSTVNDLFLWDQALYTNKLIMDEYKSQIFKPGLNGYGYGWRIMDGMVGTHKDTLTLIIHDGGIFGYRSRIVRIPEEQYTIIMLQNISLGTLNQISDKIIAILYNQPFEYPKRSAAELVALQMLNSSVDNGFQLYNLLHSERADSVFFSETDFNTVGYQLLGMNALPEAIAIFKLNVSAYPASSNTYDSLGEAYMNNGDYELAIDNYQKVFEKLPGDLNINSTFKKLLFENAQQKLAELYQILNDRTTHDK